MLTLKNWKLEEVMGGMVHASGTVLGHYRLADGKFIYTSMIKKIYRYSQEEYVFETMSGNRYHLYKEDMDPKYINITKERIEAVGVFEREEIEKSLDLEDEKFAQKCSMLKELIHIPEVTAKENMDDDGLYLIMEFMHVVKAVLKKGDCFREINPSVHVGMFQDSVLITDGYNGKVDFRYFPRDMMEPYHWSDGLENIYIHNIGNRIIVFKGTEENIECRQNEVVKIGKNIYRGEGLFSPDLVNGKSIWNVVSAK